MGKTALEGIVTVATMIVGVAIVATLVSKNAQTADVITAGGKALSGALQAAIGPVSGSSTSAAATELGQTGTLLGQNTSLIMA